MNIAIVTNIPVLETGGVEVIIRELILGLSEKHQITLASPDDIISIQESIFGGNLADFIHTPKNIPSRQWCEEFSNHLRNRKIKICHFHLGGTFALNSSSLTTALIPAVRATGIRCYTSNHQAITPFDVNQSHRPLLRRIASFALKMPGKMRCIKAVEKEFLDSEHDLRLSQKYFPFQSSKFGRIYHSCLDTQPAMIDLPHSKVILNLATICYRKGQQVLAEAFARVSKDYPEWQLRLVGKHSEQKCLEDIKKIACYAGLESRIEILGPTSDPQAAILESELYVQPSLLEALGLSVQEAMFYGRPVIGSEIGGIPEMIQHGKSGLLVKPNNVDALAHALSKMMADRNLRENLSQAAAAVIPEKGMTRSGMVAAYAAIYEIPA